MAVIGDDSCASAVLQSRPCRAEQHPGWAVGRSPRKASPLAVSRRPGTTCPGERTSHCGTPAPPYPGARADRLRVGERKTPKPFVAAGDTFIYVEKSRPCSHRGRPGAYARAQARAQARPRTRPAPSPRRSTSPLLTTAVPISGLLAASLPAGVRFRLLNLGLQQTEGSPAIAELTERGVRCESFTRPSAPR